MLERKNRSLKFWKSSSNWHIFEICKYNNQPLEPYIHASENKENCFLKRFVLYYVNSLHLRNGTAGFKSKLLQASEVIFINGLVRRSVLKSRSSPHPF